MPFVNISTSVKIEDKNQLLLDVSTFISSLTNKSKKFVMARLEDDAKLYFDDESPCCYIEIKSIGSLNPTKMAVSICGFMQEKIGIPKDKIYINFQDVPPEMWGWNGRTFG